MYSGRRVNDRGEFLDVGEISQCLDSACGGAGADRDQMFRDAAHFADPLGVVRSRDGTFDERQVVRTFDDRARSFDEVGNLDLTRDREQFILAIEQVSWQPSHEANFQTASFGLRGLFISQFANVEQRFHPVVAKNRTVLADERRPELAMTAKTDRAFHIALE